MEKQKSGCYNNIRGNKKAGRNEWHYGGCNVRDNLLITTNTEGCDCDLVSSLNLIGWYSTMKPSEITFKCPNSTKSVVKG